MYLDTFKRYQTQVRVSAAQRWEKNCRAGGRKTQKSVIKSWNVGQHFTVFFIVVSFILSLFFFLSKVFLQHALEAGKVHDDIVDEHSLLLFIDFSANHCRRDRCGEYIPGTRIGAVRTFPKSLYHLCLLDINSTLLVSDQEGVLWRTSTSETARGTGFFPCNNAACNHGPCI
jgi:hypothetical protein